MTFAAGVPGKADSRLVGEVWFHHEEIGMMDIGMIGTRQTRFTGAAVLLAVLGACGGEADEAPALTPEPSAEVVESPSLVGEWRVVMIDMADGEDLTPDPEALPMLTFSDEATPTGSRILTGSSGCNRLSGSYDAGRSGSLAFTGSPAMTRMACPEHIMRVEQVLVIALESARSYTIEDGTLTIEFGGGEIHLEPIGSEG